MKFSSVLLSSACFIVSALAAPGGSRGLAARIAKRSGSRPNFRLDNDNGVSAPNGARVVHSSNWAGAVLTSPPAGTNFTSVFGQFTVPFPALPATSTSGGQYAASVWVGIDGDTYQSAILQAGVDITVTRGRGSTNASTITYTAWYEWYPDYSYNFSPSRFAFTAGDVISLNITSFSPSKGIVILNNLTTGKSVNQTITAPISSAVIGGQNAEWIVEDFLSGGQLVPLCDFKTVVFTNCSAGTSKGDFTGTDGADWLTMITRGIGGKDKTITTVDVPSNTSVVVVYDLDSKQ